MSVCPSVTSCPVPSRHKKSHRNRKFHWKKLSDAFQGWQKYIQSHIDATAVLGKAKPYGILRHASCHTSKFHHGHWSWCWVRLPPLRRSLAMCTQFWKHMVRVPKAMSDYCHARRSRATYIQHNLEFHHLSRVGPKQLCALAHLGSTREAGTF